jgi:hypothetical protein
MLNERYETQTKAIDAAFAAQQVAMATALTAADRAVITAMTAAEKATAKAEIAADKRFDAVNEFRAQLNDQAQRFMTRGEAEAQHLGINDKIALIVVNVQQLQSRMDMQAGQAKGLDKGWTILVGVVGFSSTIVALVLRFKI